MMVIFSVKTLAGWAPLKDCNDWEDVSYELYDMGYVNSGDIEVKAEYFTLEDSETRTFDTTYR